LKIPLFQEVLIMQLALIIIS